MNNFFSRGDYQNISNVGLPALYSKHKGHYDGLAVFAVQTLHQASGVKPKAYQVAPFLAGMLATDGLYKAHMKNQRPWLSVLSPADIYTEAFAKYILIIRFGRFISIP